MSSKRIIVTKLDPIIEETLKHNRKKSSNAVTSKSKQMRQYIQPYRRNAKGRSSQCVYKFNSKPKTIEQEDWLEIDQVKSVSNS